MTGYLYRLLEIFLYALIINKGKEPVLVSLHKLGPSNAFAQKIPKTAT